MGGGNEEVSTAAGGITDFEVEDGFLWIGLAAGFIEYRVKGGVEQAGDQAGGRVVAACRFALVSTGRVEFEGRGIDMQDRMQFEQRFVDTAQFLWAEIAIVHDAACVPIAGEGERADGIEQVAIGDLAVCEICNGLSREEKAIQGGQTKLRIATVAAELLHDKTQPGEEIEVARAHTPLGQVSQPGHRVVQCIASTGGGVCLGMEEQVAILGDEEYDQPVDDAQNLPIVVLRTELPSSKPVTQRGVGGMGEEAAAEGSNGL